ncbi:hypothetical protein BLSTO_02764 [Blastocystis sp. subtype 1]
MNMSLSGMAVKDVKVDRLSNDPSVPEAFEWKGGMMARNQWIRYIVKSSSYVCRFCGVCWTPSMCRDGHLRMEEERFGIPSSLQAQELIAALVRAHDQLKEGELSSLLQNENKSELLTAIQSSVEQGKRTEPGAEKGAGEELLSDFSTLSSTFQKMEEENQELRFENQMMSRQLETGKKQIADLQKRLNESLQQSQTLFQKVQHMADCRAQLVEAQQQIQTLREAIEKQEMEMNELRETHQADQQYIKYFQEEYQQALQAVKEDTQATQKQQLSLIQQLKARVLELEEEGKTDECAV